MLRKLQAKTTLGQSKLPVRERALRAILLISAILVAQTAPVSQARQQQPSKAPPFKLVELQSDLAERRGLSTASVQQGNGVIRYSVINVEFKDAASRRAQFPDNGQRSRLRDVHVLTAFERFADLFVATNEGYENLLQGEGVVRVEGIGQALVPPPPAPRTLGVESRAVPDDIIRGGHGGMTGKNVIIAIVDTGIDFRHPDFITYDRAGRPTSRLLYLWDSTTPYQQGRGSHAPFHYPNGTPIGTLYNRDQLTAELRAGTGRRVIPATDVNGHGTACAGIAAGNGNGDRGPAGLKRESVVGVAPEADIIGVRIGTSGLENSFLLNAICEWLDRMAGLTPLVVSGSFGGHGGGHDGQTVRERQLNARFPLDKAGRALVLAAGNEGRDPIHADVSFGGQGNHKLVEWNAVRDARLAIYFDGADQDDIVIDSAGNTNLDYGWDLNPFTLQVSAHADVTSGKGGVFLSTKSGRQMKAHFYFLDQRFGIFSGQSATFNTLVGAPGTTPHAITVGSYDWNDNFNSAGQPTTLLSVCRERNGTQLPLEIGKISCYSSPGPVRFDAASGRTAKPEIVAPGEWYESSYARLPGGAGVGDWQVDKTNLYAAMNGTSAATPYTAGIVALMFQKKKELTLGEMKNLLTSKASDDPFTGRVPNGMWGFGKLNVPAVQRIFAAL